MRFRANAGDAADGDADPVVGGSEKGYVSRAEVKAGLTYPTVVYPLLESVLAARAGRSFAEQRAYVAELMAPLHRGGGDASVRLVPDTRDGRGARDADARQPAHLGSRTRSA